MAAAADLTLFLSSDGALVAGLCGNAAARLTAGGREVRCIANTQLPVRGWASWTFEPVRKEGEACRVSAAIRRSGRKQRPLAQDPGGSPRQTDAPGEPIAFRVRVPSWSAGGQPLVKIDGERAKTAVLMAGGFLEFGVPLERCTRIEVVFDIGARYVSRRSAASWGREVAVTCGPMLLTAASPANFGEDFAAPFRVVSEEKDLALVTDVRRRMPVVQAEALGGTGTLLFTPVADLGGIAGAPGAGREVALGPFRTWHRFGR
jgi:hypothetical protein